MTILMKSLKGVKKGFGFITKAFPLILLVLIICTCSGPRLILGNQSFESPTDFSLFFGKRVNPILGVMECATLRTVDRDFLSWHPQNWYTRPLYPQIHDMEYYLKLELMRKRCLLTKWYQYQLTIPSFSSRSRTVWTAPRRNSRIESLPRSLPEKNWTRIVRSKTSRGWIQPSIGRIPATTPTMGRSYNSLRTTSQGNGRGRIISSTTGESRKRR